MERFPRITSGIICHSLGYAPPTRAAQIGLDGMNGDPNYCEWIDACYRNDARAALQDSIRNRHYHTEFMADYKLAKQLVDRAIDEDKEPVFASWF